MSAKILKKTARFASFGFTLLFLPHSLVVAAALREPRIADTPRPVAVITAIIVGDKFMTEAAITEVAITRAGSEKKEPAKTDMDLFVNDKVETFAGVSVKLVFVDAALEKKNELAIGEKSQVIIGSGYCPWVCKWFADLKDKFHGKTRVVNLDNLGTKYDLLVHEDGTETLLVYEGAVLVNRIEKNALLRRENNAIARTFDLIQAHTLPITYRVPEAVGEEPCPKQENETDSRCVQSLETLKILPDKAAPLPSPEKATETQVRGALLWSSQVEIASHPSNRAEKNGNIARATEFEDSKRNDEFIQARFESIWSKQPESFIKLALVYKDWGEGAKAITNIEQAKTLYRKQNPQWQETPELLYSEAEANTLIGNYSLADQKVTQALEKDPQSVNTALNIQATIKYRQGEAALKQKNLPRARQFFAEATQGFTKVADLSSPEDKGTILANLAQSMRAVATIAQEEKKYDEALRKYAYAKQHFFRAYRLNDSAFSEKAVADIYREQSRIYYLQGRDFKGDESFKLSEETYKKTLEGNTDFSEASCGLLSLYILTEKDNEAKNYVEACLNSNPATLGTQVEVPNVKGRTKASATIFFLESGLLPQFGGEGDFVVSQSIPAGQKVRRGTTVVIELGPAPVGASR